MFVYVWSKHPGLVNFLDHAFPYQVPLLVLHAVIAYAAARRPEQHMPAGGNYPYADDDDMFGKVNPASGLPMIGPCCDVQGNAYGSSGDD